MIEADNRVIMVSELELSVRTSNVLKNAGITTAHQLMKLDRQTVMGFPHAGAKTWKEISEQQAYFRGNTYADRFTSLVSMVNGMMVADPRLRVIVEADGCLTVVTSSDTDARRRAERNGWNA